MTEDSATLVILSGGRGERFGCDKGLFPFEDRPLVTHVVDALAPLVDDVVVGVAPGQSAEYRSALGPGIRVVEDRDSHLGPLFGLFHAVEEVGGETVLLAPCDMPFTSAELYSELLVQLEGHDAVVPILNGYPEPIIGVYRRRPLKHSVVSELARGHKKLSGILQNLDFVGVDEAELLRKGISPRTFTNLNSPP